MTTTTMILPPLVLTKEEIIDALTTEHEEYGMFAGYIKIGALRYLENELTNEEQSFVWKEIARKRE